MIRWKGGSQPGLFRMLSCHFAEFNQKLLAPLNAVYMNEKGILKGHRVMGPLVAECICNGECLPSILRPNCKFFTILALLTGEGIGFLTLNIAVSGFLKKEVFDV